MEISFKTQSTLVLQRLHLAGNAFSIGIHCQLILSNFFCAAHSLRSMHVIFHSPINSHEHWTFCQEFSQYN